MSAITDSLNNTNTTASTQVPAAPANGGNGQFQAVVIAPDSNYEDLTILKVLACVPFIGNIVTMVVGITLNKKVDSAVNIDDVPKMVTLIKISNHHNICSIIRNVLSAAAVVTLIALFILAPVIGIVTCALFGGLAGYHGYLLQRDSKYLADWEARLVPAVEANAGAPAQANPADAAAAQA